MPRRSGMRPRWSVLLVLVAAAVALGLTAPVARASCVGPSLTAPPGLSPSASVSVTGENFFAGCPDAIGQSGCSGPVVQDPARPMSDVALVLVQDGRTWPLGRADSDPTTFAIAWSVTLPAEVAAGPAQLQAGTAVLDVTVVAAP